MKQFWIVILALKLSETCCFQPRPHLRNSVRSNSLFILNFNRNKNREKKESVETEVDPSETIGAESELSSFFRGLGQWPLYPSSSSSESSSSGKDLAPSKTDEAAQSMGRYRGVNPLSNLIKLQVVLDLADGLKMNETDQYFASIIAAAEQIFKASDAKDNNPDVTNDPTNLANVTTVEELIESEKWLRNLQNVASPFEGMDGIKKIARLSETQNSAITSDSTSQQSLGQAAEAMLKVATSRIEYLVNEASKGLSPNIINDLVFRSTQVFSNNGTTSVEQLTNDIVSAAENIAKARGLDVQFAAERARDATKGASTMVNIANRVFASGYAYGSRSGVAGSEGSPFTANVPADELRPLFADFATAERIEPFQYQNVVTIGATMGILAGAIYDDTMARCHKVEHSLVANGTTADVGWIVTDSIELSSNFADPETLYGSSNKDEPIFVRTITLRGFDASDSTVDRERLLQGICSAAGKPINSEIPNVVFHSGLLGIATEIYEDVKKYIEWASPDHKIVFNGHSIGGSLSVLLLLLMTAEKGPDYVQERVLRVFSHGTPPIAAMTKTQSFKQKLKRKATLSKGHGCQVLEAFGLPAAMVFGYIQPYDPIVRFLTEYDPLYPLVDDLGPDDVTLYATGPARTLRPVARALFQAWEGWPEFRDKWKGTNQRYQPVGVQHILLPEPLRYLNDRFFTTNIGVPPTEAIVRISSNELLPALNTMFPLDVFQISLLPQAVRSFLHHFYPAYDTTIANYAEKVERKKVDAAKVERKKVDR